MPVTLSEKESQPLIHSPRLMFVVFLTLLAWITLFILGAVVDTNPYRSKYLSAEPASIDPALSSDGELAPQSVEGAAPGTRGASPASGSASSAESGFPLTVWYMVKSGDLVVVALCYTVSNLALLCFLAGMLGAFAQRANLGPDGTQVRLMDRSYPYVSAALRGFVLYLMAISGLLLIAQEPFSITSADQYIRMAGFLSLASFLVNYNPGLFGQLLTRLGRGLEQQGNQENEEAQSEANGRAG